MIEAEHLVRPAAGAAAPATFLVLTRVRARGPGGWDRHRHAEHELIVVGVGRYRATVNGEACVLAPGDALVVKPGDWHADELQTGTGYHALWFRLPGGLFAPGIAVGQQIARRVEALPPALARLETLAAAGATPARLDTALSVVIDTLLGGLPAEALAPAFAPDQGLLARLEAVFARRPAGSMAVEELARACGLGRRALERRCRAELGCGPMQALARWRAYRAAELLRSTDWPVRAVSDALGFANPFHFSRAFARVHGASPARWRAALS